MNMLALGLEASRLTLFHRCNMYRRMHSPAPLSQRDIYWRDLFGVSPHKYVYLWSGAMQLARQGLGSTSRCCSNIPIRA
jgi:hypothetical protein